MKNAVVISMLLGVFLLAGCNRSIQKDESYDSDTDASMENLEDELEDMDEFGTEEDTLIYSDTLDTDTIK